MTTTTRIKPDTVEAEIVSDLTRFFEGRFYCSRSLVGNVAWALEHGSFTADCETIDAVDIDDANRQIEVTRDLFLPLGVFAHA